MRHRPRRGHADRDRRELTPRPLRRTAAIALIAIAAVACTSDDDPTPSAAGSTTSTATTAAADPGAVPFRADLNQNRIQEGTREVNAKLRNISDEPLTVASVSLDSDQFEPMPPAAKNSTFVPGQTIDLVVEYGTPTCEGDLTELAYDVTLDDGMQYTVPVNHHGVAWLGRLYDRECALASIASIASIRYGDEFRRERVDGELVLVGDLVVTAAPDADPAASFTVDEFFGSVLVNVGAYDPSELPRTFTASDGELRLPMTIGAFRCDPHARGESSQTFLWSVYLTPADGPQVRLILKPGQRLQLEALDLIDDVCPDPHGNGSAQDLRD